VCVGGVVWCVNERRCVGAVAGERQGSVVCGVGVCVVWVCGVCVWCGVVPKTRAMYWQFAHVQCRLFWHTKQKVPLARQSGSNHVRTRMVGTVQTDVGAGICGVVP